MLTYARIQAMRIQAFGVRIIPVASMLKHGILHTHVHIICLHRFSAFVIYYRYFQIGHAANPMIDHSDMRPAQPMSGQTGGCRGSHKKDAR